MPKRGDGNEQDIRVRPELDAHSLDADNPMTGNHPPGADICEDGFGNQIDVPPPPVPPGSSGEALEIKYDWSDIRGVCPAGFDNRAMDELFIKLLRNHFALASNITNPILKQYIYSDDPTISKIRIVMNTTFSGSNAGSFPAIIVKRLKQQSVRISMGDQGERGLTLQGQYSYVRTIVGSHRLICAGVSDGVTEALATEVFEMMTCLSPVLRSILPLLDFEAVGMDEIGIIDELGNNLVVPVDVTYKYEWGWTVLDIAPELTAARVETTTTLSVQAVTDVSLRPCIP